MSKAIANTELNTWTLCKMSVSHIFQHFFLFFSIITAYVLLTYLTKLIVSYLSLTVFRIPMLSPILFYSLCYCITIQYFIAQSKATLFTLDKKSPTVFECILPFHFDFRIFIEGIRWSYRFLLSYGLSVLPTGFLFVVMGDSTMDKSLRLVPFCGIFAAIIFAKLYSKDFFYPYLIIDRKLSPSNLRNKHKELKKIVGKNMFTASFFPAGIWSILFILSKIKPSPSPLAWKSSQVLEPIIPTYVSSLLFLFLFTLTIIIHIHIYRILSSSVFDDMTSPDKVEGMGE